MASVTYAVTGMTCEHCSRAVSAELESLVGVSDVRVDLVPDGRSSVLVVSDAPLAVQAVAAALDEAGGYRLAGGEAGGR
jgi:copper chaperone CopZ